MRPPFYSLWFLRLTVNQLTFIQLQEHPHWWKHILIHVFGCQLLRVAPKDWSLSITCDCALFNWILWGKSQLWVWVCGWKSLTPQILRFSPFLRPSSFQGYLHIEVIFIIKAIFIFRSSIFWSSPDDVFTFECANYFQGLCRNIRFSLAWIVFLRQTNTHTQK